MKSKVITVLLIIILVVLILLFLKPNIYKVGDLVNPGSFNNIPSATPTPAPPQAPKTFEFDSQTDLKIELEKVNPQILDSDFE